MSICSYIFSNEYKVVLLLNKCLDNLIVIFHSYFHILKLNFAVLKIKKFQKTFKKTCVNYVTEGSKKYSKFGDSFCLSFCVK